MRDALLKSVLFTFVLSIFQGYSQGTPDEYRSAIAADTLFANKVYRAPSKFFWQGDSLCWYKNTIGKGVEYIVVNPEKGTREPAFDHQKLAVSLGSVLGKEVDARNVGIDDLHFRENGFSFKTDSLEIFCSSGNYELEIVKRPGNKQRKRGYWGGRFDETANKPVQSPDSLYVAFIKDHNLYVKERASGKETRLSYDGAPGNYYSTYMQWSPDGRYIMAYKVRPGSDRKIRFVRSSPRDRLQPVLESRDYLKPGDELPFRSPQLFHISTGKHVGISTDLFRSQYSLSAFRWRDDSSAFTFEYNQRGHQVYRVLSADAESGEVSVIVGETSPTFIDYSGKKYRYDTSDGKELIWASERDGYNHLYLYDARSGKVKNRITRGEWPVRDVVKVDEKNRYIYFTASGVDKGQDPYLLHYFRIGFDGSGLLRYTRENGNHEVFFSENHKYYIDRYSRVDAPQVTELKQAAGQKKILTLEKADITDLLATGWKMPEVFHSKGRDGKTDIWGIVVRPTNFDPEKKYPVIEYIYAGPHNSFVPKSFRSFYSGMSSLAELGFVVVQIDGMGTSNRSKAFHDVCWKNLKDAGFPDRMLWIKALARKYAYIDADRVGIHGTSAGGQNAGAAVVFHSDFYKAAVASCGCHDNRMDKIWWNEQWMGYPVGPHYAACSNVENAAGMNGKLLLIVGEVDDNVDPATTMQFADALIREDKDFELVVIPGMGHSSGGDYGERKRRDFFVKSLMDKDPPVWDEVYR
ncbi:S9 family peptidase [Sinomicrobium soli]|uniref:S9 family peptidase n=1 Tax=Sinomicrobium sp. N-1-3-6 TaxID=2219864 RepID=UPI000DCEAD8E|nr:S9 family peptidase [Sinomicrobium sp. N-1-3-6]RAV27627.1 S9 family peptidase [Sinomicrobium sp. N-1-3-6]